MIIQTVEAAPIKRAVSVLWILEWAFGRECARIEFDEDLFKVDASKGHGLEYVLIQQAMLGAQVDQSRGQSSPSHDAEIVGAIVASLPEGAGGRRMAMIVAENARIGGAPDWMRGVFPRLVPDDWVLNQYGRRGKSWPTGETYPRRNRKGVIVHEPGNYTPCHWHPSPAQLARVRRNYLDWWGALLDIGARLSRDGVLCRYEINGDMPPMSPWRDG